MITTLILRIVWLAVLVVTSPLRLLEDVTLPSFMQNTAEFLHNYVVPLGGIIPLTTISYCISFFIVFELGVLTWGGINWIIRRFPTQS